MPDSTTANYGWAYPTVNADANTWGTTLNAAIVAIDARMKSNAGAACQAANNLSDLANAATARANLGLGSAATLASTMFAAAGSALLVANNLSDLNNASAARSNLGLGSAATEASSAFDGAGAASAAQSAAISAAEAASCQRASNLSDVSSASSARANLGLGSIAVTNITVSSSAPSGTPANGDVWYQI